MSVISQVDTEILLFSLTKTSLENNRFELQSQLHMLSEPLIHISSSLKVDYWGFDIVPWSRLKFALFKYIKEKLFNYVCLLLCDFDHLYCQFFPHIYIF